MAALARFQQRQAEEGGAYVLTETSATQLIVDDGRVVGVRSGDKGRGKDGEPLGNFEPGTDIKAEVTVLAEGCWGHLTGAAIREFDLADGREPQVWELGVKELWKVPKPLDRVIHTIGPWPLKLPAKYGQIGGTWLYPMKDEKTGDDLVSIGFVIDLEYRDATTSAHDLLQLFKTHPLVKGILEGGERVGWGAKALPGGGYWSMPKLSMPGAVLVGDAGGMVDTVALKGVHHCIKSGILAAEAIYASLKGEQPLSSYEDAVENSLDRQRALPGAQHPPAVLQGLHPGRPDGQPGDRHQGQAARRAGWSGTATTSSRCSSGTLASAIPSPTASTSSTSSPRSTSPATRRATTRPNHIRCTSMCRGEIAETWAWMCPAGVYEIPDDAPANRSGGRDRQLHQLRAVRRDHGQGRPPDPARGRRRAAVSADVTCRALATFARVALLLPRDRSARVLCAASGAAPARRVRRAGRRRRAARAAARLQSVSGHSSRPRGRSASPA